MNKLLAQAEYAFAEAQARSNESGMANPALSPESVSSAALQEKCKDAAMPRTDKMRERCGLRLDQQRDAAEFLCEELETELSAAQAQISSLEEKRRDDIMNCLMIVARTVDGIASSLLTIRAIRAAFPDVFKENDNG